MRVAVGVVDGLGGSQQRRFVFPFVESSPVRVD